MASRLKLDIHSPGKYSKSPLAWVIDDVYFCSEYFELRIRLAVSVTKSSYR